MTAGGDRIRACCTDDLRQALAREGLDTVDGAFAYAAGHDMTPAHLGHRGRMRLELDTQAGRRLLFMKRYDREPWKWRVQRWWTYGRGTSPAGIEMDSILAVQQAGISTIDEALCGERLAGKGHQRSYIILSAVPGEALEQCVEGFLSRHAGRPKVIEQFTLRLADLFRRLHGAGYVHRDLYTSHVFLSEPQEADGGFELHLIDLARMFRPRWRRMRWFVKDLAAMRYSMPETWAREHWQAFLAAYLGPECASRLGRWMRAIERKVQFMRWKLERRARRRAKDAR